ncbi:MAG TPA: hypothetical protein VKR59_16995 [Terriglobales bacterium]|nr:hypothetical protein [Terriglobales bacterium]
MNREALMSGLIACVRPETGYSAERVSSKVVLSSKDHAVGVVLFGHDSDVPRCVVWHGARLVGECQFSGESGWKIFPIVGGKRSPSPLFNIDPIHFLIEEDSGARLLRATAV